MKEQEETALRKTEQELTRDEYLRLLHTAKTDGKERTFFLIKAICCVGLKVGEIPQLTVEMVQEGRGVLVSKGTAHTVEIPSAIRGELLCYAERAGIADGPVFQNRNGHAVDRVWVFNAVQDVAEKAGVPTEKCSPKSLRAVYLRTQKDIYEKLDYIAKQAYEQLLEAEQLTNAW